MFSNKEFWEKRFREEGKVWGEDPSKSVYQASEFFRKHDVKSILVPGSGYGRNTRLFSSSGFDVTGIEISATACKLAQQFDPASKVYEGSVLDMSFVPGTFDAIYSYNLLHLFSENDRNLFIQECIDKLGEPGFAFFTVFSEDEPTFGQGRWVESNTYESRPDRPTHYFTEDDLREHFQDFEIIETGIVQEPEDHGGQPHTHILRYVFVKKAA
ncbi:MAG: class I SAM-dependent methyltransferase [Dehalococcoidales bacterium]|nr:MAG: class I SAM-dependent methyltransferase [Dehalococcoidales bacterium]